MKKGLLIALAVFALMLSACSGPSEETDALPTPSQPLQTQSPTPVPTTPPDFSDVDFSGIWVVDQLIDSVGNPISEGEMMWYGADFTLELLPNGTYFVYDGDGQVLGQGTYSAVQGRLTLKAGETQTVYEIADADTLRCLQPDGSVTIMKRQSSDENDADENQPDAENDAESEGETGASEDETGVSADGGMSDAAQKA